MFGALNKRCKLGDLKNYKSNASNLQKRVASDTYSKSKRQFKISEENVIRSIPAYDSRDFKNPGRGESETRPEVTFPVSDEERMRLAFSPALENAAWRDLASSGKREYLALLLKAKHYN